MTLRRLGDAGAGSADSEPIPFLPCNIPKARMHKSEQAKPEAVKRHIR